jgi:predicted nucleic acid-binding protein
VPAGDARFVLDNTAVSNFSAVGRMDILLERYGGGGRLVVTREVLLEAEKGPHPEAIRRAIEGGWVELRSLYADSEEHGVFVELRNRGFGSGEASSIAVCSTGGTWVFVSDDLDARREAGRRGTGVVGTYGILAREVAEGKMDLEEGDGLLRRMMEHGFRTHSDDLRSEVERLRGGRWR